MALYEAIEVKETGDTEDAAFEARLTEAVGRGIADIEAGRFTTSVEEAFARAEELRRKRA